MPGTEYLVTSLLEQILDETKSVSQWSQPYFEMIKLKICSCFSLHTFQTEQNFIVKVSLIFVMPYIHSNVLTN